MPVLADGLMLSGLAHSAQKCTQLQLRSSRANETTFDFISPLHWDTGVVRTGCSWLSRLTALEAQINAEVSRLYGISDADRAAIEAELAGEGRWTTKAAKAPDRWR